ncbi:hypothetical protein CGLO_05508 [Colletotrichum gloeosporioides Cg-14]|nr:hypothetical protein CGLO_05508 [Colletotrichum gloeosporioides Cg-14]
MEKSRH